jgi:hypothetical protein
MPRHRANDDAWWSFANDQIEATAGFFVAFTRKAARRLLVLRVTRRSHQDRRSLSASHESWRQNDQSRLTLFDSELP